MKKVKGALPSVSIIIPTCDRPEMLKRTLKSVLAQDYENIIEIIITDDGNDEGTKIVAEDFQKKDSRIVFAKNTRYKKGPVGNKQNAVDLAKGDIIALIDDDDVLLHGAISSLMGVYIENGGKYQIVFGNCLRSDNKKFSGKHYGKDEEVRYEDFLCGRYEGEYFGINESWILKSGKVNDDFAEMESISGLHLWKKWNLRGYYIHKPVRLYTIHSRQVTQNYESNREKAEKTFNAYQMYLKKYGEELRDKCRDKYAYVAQLTSYFAKISGSNKESVEYAKKAFKVRRNLFSVLWLLVSFSPVSPRALVFLKRVKKDLFK